MYLMPLMFKESLSSLHFGDKPLNKRYMCLLQIFYNLFTNSVSLTPLNMKYLEKMI